MELRSKRKKGKEDIYENGSDRRVGDDTIVARSIKD